MGAVRSDPESGIILWCHIQSALSVSVTLPVKSIVSMFIYVPVECERSLFSTLTHTHTLVRTCAYARTTKMLPRGQLVQARGARRQKGASGPRATRGWGGKRIINSYKVLYSLTVNLIS